MWWMIQGSETFTIWSQGTRFHQRKFFSERHKSRVISKAKDKLSRAKRVTLTCDAWTSQALAARYITEDGSFSSHILQTRDTHDLHSGH